MPLRNQQSGRDSSRRNRSARLGLESLETRTVLSSSVSGSTLDLSGIGVQSSYSATDILVQYRTTQPEAVLPGTTVGQKLGLVQNLYEINLSSGVSVSDALSAYRASSAVALAEPDYQLASSQIPNDTKFPQQWALQNTGQNSGTTGADIGVTQAWDVTQGSSSTIVAVNDTGIDYSHPDLYQNIWLNQGEIPVSRMKNLVDVYKDGFISFRDLNNPINQGPGKITDLNHNGYIDAGDLLQPMIKDSNKNDTGMGGWVDGSDHDKDGYANDIVGWNFNGNNNNPFDDNGHGTHVAGIIGAMGNNGVGVTGINWNIQLMPIKFLDANGHGTISEFIQGLNYSVAHGAKITNNSWTGADPSQALIAAITNARAQNQIFVAAAGNDASNNDSTAVYPASFALDNVVSVAATDNKNNLASFSNYGLKTVDIAAPGVDVISTLTGGGYGNKSGTSMATPQVTGVMALVWSQHPDWTYLQVINQVENTVTKVPSLAGKVASGGVVNAAGALGVATVASTPAQIIGSSASGPSANTLSTIRVTFDRAISPSTFTPSDLTLLCAKGRIAFTSVTVVAGSGNRTFDLHFPVQTAPGVYTLYVGNNAKDVAGNKIARYQTQFKISQPSPATNPTPTPKPSPKPSIATYTSNTAVSIPPGGRGVSLLLVGESLPISHVTVTLNLEYPQVGDLYIHLQAPDGTNIILSNQLGGTTPNFIKTTFDDNAPTSIGFASAPFTGHSYQPMVALNYLNGKNAQGMWKLWVENSGASTGKLVSWSLNVTSGGSN